MPDSKNSISRLGGGWNLYHFISFKIEIAFSLAEIGGDEIFVPKTTQNGESTNEEREGII